MKMKPFVPWNSSGGGSNKMEFDVRDFVEGLRHGAEVDPFGDRPNVGKLDPAARGVSFRRGRKSQRWLVATMILHS